ncbi:MAG TPA: DUF748 domain-containing protein [Noviherbaspirillum sp.]|uniref:DUF748 domain-containing protein n=1 Tax=Noviherbaspirillum sp. TaxID=1926288 RepID=UPI002DDCF84A|nr:DUF748 domain-containing protein [Noviherbaspirillum sp.]HEV2610749.1 DUF748 domain-containing protein [Noviherbaspirillum sp.]
MSTRLKRIRRIAFILFTAVAVLAGVLFAALHFATRELRSQVEQALGADSEVGEIVVGWSAIEVLDVRIRGPKGWPAQDALRARRIVIKPDLLGLFSARIHIPSITIDRAYLSALRSRDGKLKLLPSLLDRPAATDAANTAASPTVTIGKIELKDGALDFFDATVRQPAHRIRLEDLTAGVEDLRVPALDGRTRIRLNGTVKGVQRHGTLKIDGWAELASLNSEIRTRLQGVDLVAFQPYLIKASETGVRRGTLDLSIKSTVRNNRLHAPGTVTLIGLELANGSGSMSTFMGAPRQLVVAALKDRNDRISIDFVLDGNLSDPRFSLNESLSRRIGAAVAGGLGISLEGVARGIGGAAEGLGGVVKKLFGQ